MTTKVPQEYTEDKEPEQPEQLYYGPYRPPEEAFTTDLLRIYSDIERGGLSASAYVADRVSSVFDKSDEDIPATQEERDERLMQLQRTMTTLQRSGTVGVLPAILGYFKNKNEVDIFEPSGKVRPVDTTMGTVAQIGTFVAGGVGSYKALPEALPSLVRVLASEQAVEQVMIPSGTDNIANIIYAVLPENVREDTIGEVADFLSTSPDDTESAQRLKTSLVSLGVTALIAGVGVAGVAAGKGLFNTDVGQAALENLRKIKPSFKGKTPEELTKSQQADVIVESLNIAREQAAKVKEDSARALNMRGEGVGVPSGKPRPTRDQFEDGPEGSTKFKAALTRWKTQDTPKDLTLPTMSSVLEETAEGVTQVQAQNASFFKRLQQRFFTSRGYYTPKAQRLFDDSRNAQKAAIQEVSGIALRIKKEIDRVGSLTSEGATATGRTTEEVTDQVRKAFEFNATKDLYELPRGERVEFYRTNFGLTPELAEQVYKAREMIDQFSRRLYNNVATTPAMRATIESNLGSYFKRSYRAWEDPGFRPDPALKTDAVEATYNDLMRTPPHAAEIKRLKEQDGTGEELEKYLLKIRRQAESEIDDKLEFVQDREVIDFLAQVRGAPGLHKRGDLNAETRALLGEIHDPLENMILTITKSSRVYEQNNFYTRIAALGRSGGWIGTRNPAEGRTVRIEGTNNFSLDGFADDTAAKAAGLPNASSSWTYTTPEIARALNNKEVVPTMFDMENSGGEIFRFLAGAKGATQASKTVYNHTVHIRNAYGVGHFTLANGINPFVRDGYEPFKVLVNDIFQGGDEALDQTYNKFLRLGLVDTNVRVNEFRALLSTGFEDNPTDYINRTILSPESPLRKFLEPVTPPPGVVNFAPSVYRATDDYGKISGYAYELKQLKAAYPNEPIEVLEQEAAEIIKNTFPNYSRVPRGVQQLRYLPIGDYTGFVSESIRTTAHIIKRGAQEIRSDNPIIKARGRQRLAGYVTAGAVGFSAAGTASQYMMGWDEEDSKAYNILAEGKYSTGADNRVWSYDSEGNVQFVDTRSLDAFSVIRDPFVIAANRALTGDLEAEELDAYITDAVATAAWNFAEPYVSPSMLTEAFLDIGVGAFHPRGENHKGKVIFEPKMDSVDRALVVIDRLWETIEPGSIPNIQKLDEALQGIENPYDGEPKRQKDTEIYANFLGFRRQPFDPDRSLQIAVERYNDLSERNYTSSLNLENNAETLEQALEDYIKVQGVERNAQQDLYAVVMAYAHINDQDSMYKYDNTMAALEKLGVDTVFRAKLVNGSFHPDKINQVFNELIDRQELVRAFPDAEQYMFAYESVRNRLNKESLSKYNSDAFEVLLDDQAEIEERTSKAKGGEVLDVPNVPREPDQRIDKMTGLPYDQQAGTAFVDEEDPLRRLGFTGGGEVDPLRRLGFVPGGTVIARGLRDLFTPTKTVGSKGSKRVVQDPDKPVVMTQTEELEETLDPRMGRAMEAETASSVMPAPGKFFDPEKSSYKEGLTRKAEDAGIEIDLEFGKYLKMGRELEDVSNKTFQNLYVTARPPMGVEQRGSVIGPLPEVNPTREQGKLSTFGASNKAVARANEYDGADLTIDEMKANYKRNTGVKSPPRVQTNLLQPDKFKIITDEGPKRLDNPIVSVEAPKSRGGHFYALDYQLVGPVRMNVLTAKNKEGKVNSPNLRPETVGEVKLGNIIGTVQTSGKGKTHPLYDYIEVDGTPSLPEGVTKREKFNQGGFHTGYGSPEYSSFAGAAGYKYGSSTAEDIDTLEQQIKQRYLTDRGIPLTKSEVKQQLKEEVVSRAGLPVTLVQRDAQDLIKERIASELSSRLPVDVGVQGDDYSLSKTFRDDEGSFLSMGASTNSGDPKFELSFRKNFESGGKVLAALKRKRNV